MRQRIYNWQGQRFGYIWLEGEPGQSLEKQSQGLFDRAGSELASLGLALDKNVVRTRVYGRTRDARNIVSAARGRAFSGQARAATSSFISSDHLDWYSDVALELWAMATRGLIYTTTHQDEMLAFARSEFPTASQEDLQASLNRAFVDQVYSTDGFIPPEAWTRGEAVVRQAGILKKHVGYDEVIDMRFVNEVRKELGVQ